MRRIPIIALLALAACAPTLTFNQSFLVPEELKLAPNGYASLKSTGESFDLGPIKAQETKTDRVEILKVHGTYVLVGDGYKKVWTLWPAGKDLYHFEPLKLEPGAGRGEARGSGRADQRGGKPRQGRGFAREIRRLRGRLRQVPGGRRQAHPDARSRARRAAFGHRHQQARQAPVLLRSLPAQRSAARAVRHRQGLGGVRAAAFRQDLEAAPCRPQHRPLRLLERRALAAPHAARPGRAARSGPGRSLRHQPRVAEGHYRGARG